MTTPALGIVDAVRKLSEARLRRENARTALSSPSYPSLTKEERIRIAEALAQACMDLEAAILDVITASAEGA